MELLVAISDNNVIGNNNKLLWNIPEDLNRFYRLTKNNVVVMGRKTFESIGKPLKNRINIVITNNCNLQVSDELYFTSYENFKELLKLIKLFNKKIFIIGGKQIYDLFLDECKILNITLIYKSYNGDTKFYFNKDNYELKDISEPYYSDNEDCFYQFLTYKKIE